MRSTKNHDRRQGISYQERLCSTEEELVPVSTTEELKITDGLMEFVQEWKNKPGNLIMILHRT